MFVGDAMFFEFTLELFVVDLLKKILEAAVIRLEDGVLGGQVDWKRAHQTVIKRGSGEVADRVVQIVHGERDTTAWKRKDLMFDLLAVLADEAHAEPAFAGDLEIGGAILVTISVAPDHDRLRPSGHQPRHVLTDDGLPKDHAAQDIADRTIGRTPHFLEVELLHAGLIWRDGRAFHPDTHLFDGFGRLNRDLVIGGIAVGDAEIKIAQLDVEIGKDERILDGLPDDPGHFIAVELDDRIRNLDLCHGELTFSKRQERRNTRRSAAVIARAREPRKRVGADHARLRER